jgi:hypothetical protein
MFENNIIYVHKKIAASSESIYTTTKNSQRDNVPVKLNVLPSRVIGLYCLHQ